ncbi:MAG: type 4a pilus biogenesis protein PilO [Cystobacterineae bacterium]|nr:type 4a pilus biogenesis protein PilO [Cystobacterineae bacterium]
MEKYLEKLNSASWISKVSWTMGVALFLTGIHYYFVVMPIEEKIKKQNIQKIQLEKVLAEKQKAPENLRKLQQEMTQLESGFKLALEELPDEKDIDELLWQISEVARRSGLNIAQVEPLREIPVGFFAKIPVRMTVRGNFQEISLFFQKISHMRRIVNVSNIRLSKVSTQKSDAAAAGSSPILKADFLANTFRFLGARPATDQKAIGGAPK